ncbi:hypothetical protein [Dokdonia sp.]|uniref:hypothetical protein n=1 Tax=Dokdonia sp. TaxID=2024995 RepID=UPI003262E27D
MESNKVEQLLEAYFEGATTLLQEEQLRTYFKGSNVAPHLESYIGMFSAFALAKEETLDVPIQLPKQKKKINYRWLSGVAAVAVLAIGLAVQFINKDNDNEIFTTYASEEVAVQKTKQALGFMGKMFSESTAQLGTVKEFNTTTSSFFKQ